VQIASPELQMTFGSMTMKMRGKVSILTAIKKCKMIHAQPGMKPGKSIMAENGIKFPYEP